MKYHQEPSCPVMTLSAMYLHSRLSHCSRAIFTLNLPLWKLDENWQTPRAIFFSSRETTPACHMYWFSITPGYGTLQQKWKKMKHMCPYRKIPMAKIPMILRMKATQASAGPIETNVGPLIFLGLLILQNQPNASAQTRLGRREPFLSSNGIGNFRKLQCRGAFASGLGFRGIRVGWWFSQAADGRGHFSIPINPLPILSHCPWPLYDSKDFISIVLPIFQCSCLLGFRFAYHQIRSTPSPVLLLISALLCLRFKNFVA